MKKKLILFTRYPVAGRAKTRLIPALGADGAAELQRRMTEGILATAAALASGAIITLETHHLGGSAEQMDNWLGPERIYREQAAGDLGDKLAAAFTEAFRDGSREVIIIGADCPAITPAILADAFNSLKRHDLVLGPATDGGYYLIGLKRPCPELFRNRSWGSNLLLTETVRAASELFLKTSLLEELTDVDRPEDLKNLGNYSYPE